jgi:hypothetical protein
VKVVDAQWTFDVDAQGAVTQTTLHQNGRDMAAKRLNEADAKQVGAEIEAHNADVAKRFKEQKQSPGTEAAIRRHIQELQTGEPNYDLMSPQFASVTRAQLAQLKIDRGAVWRASIRHVQRRGTWRRGYLRSSVRACKDRVANLAWTGRQDPRPDVPAVVATWRGKNRNIWTTVYGRALARVGIGGNAAIFRANCRKGEQRSEGGKQSCLQM